MTTEQARTLIINEAVEKTQEQQEQHEQPLPLRKSKTIAAEFPVNALPKLLRDATLALHSKIQAPLAICAQSILAVSNLAIQAHADVMLPIIEQRRPISCFFLTIAESGERKSSCDNEALSAIKEYEVKLKQEHDAAVEDWQNASDSYDSQKQAILKDKKRYPDFTTRKHALNNLGQKPIPPLTPIIICPEPTFEGLCRLMQNSHPSLGIFSSEGGQFIGGHGMKEENKIRTATALSSAWDGESIKRIRAAEQPIIIMGKRLSMHLMVQPNIAATFLSDHDLKSQGLLSRLLVISPTSAIGTRLNNKADGMGQTHQKQVLQAFKQQIMNTLQSQPKEKADNASGSKTRVITLNDEAVGLYLRYSNQIERMMAQNERYENIRGFANKLPEHATRIAATLALIDDMTTTDLTSDHMQRAIAMADFYATEALRLIDEGTTDPKLVLAEKLLNWLHNSWQEPDISLPDIYQSSLNAIDTKAKAVEIVKVLESHGWLVRNEGVVEVKERMRQESWSIMR